MNDGDNDSEAGGVRCTLRRDEGNRNAPPQRGRARSHRAAAEAQGASALRTELD